MEGISDAQVLALLVVAPCVVISFLKGKPWTGVVGLFIGIAAVIGAIRLAKPTSWWARRNYGEAKLLQAAHRFPSEAAAVLKTCPACAQTVNAKAGICRFCGHYFA